MTRVAAKSTDYVQNQKSEAPSLYLCEGAFVARDQGKIIFLALDDDQYVQIEDRYSDLLADALGLPADSQHERLDAATQGEFEALLSDMFEAKLITRNPALGRKAALIEIPLLQEIPILFLEDKKRIAIQHIVAFIRAAVVARLLLKTRSIASITRRVSLRRSKKKPAHVEYESLVSIYCRLRPFAMSRKDRCVLDALTMIEFLAAFEIYPGWHFGVRPDPFQAHCWVQDQGILYNDHVENVCRFSPILVV